MLKFCALWTAVAVSMEKWNSDALCRPHVGDRCSQQLRVASAKQSDFQSIYFRLSAFDLRPSMYEVVRPSWLGSIKSFDVDIPIRHPELRRRTVRLEHLHAAVLLAQPVDPPIRVHHVESAPAEQQRAGSQSGRSQKIHASPRRSRTGDLRRGAMGSFRRRRHPRSCDLGTIIGKGTPPRNHPKGLSRRAKRRSRRRSRRGGASRQALQGSSTFT